MSVNRDKYSLSVAQLLESLKGETSLEKRVHVLNNLGEQHIMSQPQKAKSYVEEALSLSAKIPDPTFRAKSLNTLGVVYWHLSEYEKTRECHEEALRIWSTIPDKKGRARSYLGIGNSCQSLGYYRGAVDHYFKALEIQQEINDKQGIAGTTNNIGVVYKNLGDYDKSLKYYLKALRIKEELLSSNEGLSRPFSIANSLINVGMLFYFQKDYDKSLEYLYKSLDAVDHEKEVYTVSTVLNDIGMVYRSKGEYQKAIKYLSKALEQKKGIEDKTGISVSFQELGQTYLELNQYDEAMSFFQKGLDLSESIGALNAKADFLTRIGEVYLAQDLADSAIKNIQEGFDIRKDLGAKDDLSESYALLSRVFEKKKAYQQALKLEKEYSRMKGELFNEEKTRIINSIQVQYEVNKKNLEIEKLNLRQEILQETNQELESFAGKAAHDLKEPLRMMSSYSQLLIRRFGDQLPEDGHEYLLIIYNAANRLDNQLQNLIDYARSDMKRKKWSAIHLEEVMEVVQSNLRLSLEEKNGQLVYQELPIVKGTFFHMVQLFQNVISNSIKFTIDKEPFIKVSAEHQGNFVLVSVKDNGIGILEDSWDKIFGLFTRAYTRKVFAGNGIGLATCKRIVDSLGGKIWIERSDQTGTLLQFTLPKPNPSYLE